MFAFSMFLLANQNIHAQLCTNVKNHNHHMNYLILDYSISHTRICLMEMLFVVTSSKNVLKFFSFFWYPNYEWTHLELPSSCQVQLDFFVFFWTTPTICVFFPWTTHCLFHYAKNAILWLVLYNYKWINN